MDRGWLLVILPVYVYIGVYVANKCELDYHKPVATTIFIWLWPLILLIGLFVMAFDWVVDFIRSFVKEN